jgi:multiple sugar transport system permease protein
MRPLASGLKQGALVACAMLAAFPFAWMLLTSLKSEDEAFAFPPMLLPAHPQWGNYALAWAAAPFTRYVLNSTFIAGSVALGVALTALWAGYAFGHLEFRGRKLLFALYLSTLMIPFEVVLIPDFLLVRQLGWYDHYAALIVPWSANAFSVFLLSQFFRSLPRGFFEAAQLDGCGHWQYMWTVGAPLARPALATAALFAFLGSWNGLLWPLLVTQTDAIRPIEVGLRHFLTSEGPHPQLLMAASTLAMLPVLALFLLAQRTFVEGVAAGLKG